MPFCLNGWQEIENRRHEDERPFITRQLNFLPGAQGNLRRKTVSCNPVSICKETSDLYNIEPHY